MSEKAATFMLTLACQANFNCVFFLKFWAISNVKIVKKTL